MNESIHSNVFEGVLLSGKVTVCSPTSKDLIVPRGTKFILKKSTEEIDAGIKSLTVYMTCSFTPEADSSTKLDSDKISDELKKKFQSEGPFDSHVYVMDGTGQAAATQTTDKRITLDVNIQGMSITHEQVHEAIVNFLGPEYKLEILRLKQTHEIILRSQVVLLTQVCEEHYTLPKGAVFFVHLLDSAESQENYTKVAYKTIDNVNFIHYIKKRGKIFHFFEASDSQFILEKTSPSMTVYLTTLFSITDHSLFDTTEIVKFLKMVYQSYGEFGAYAYIIMTPQTVLPNGSKLIKFSSEIIDLPISSASVCSNLSQYFGDDYVIMFPN